MRSACVDGWPWYIASITSGIAIVTLLFVIVIRDLQNQCKNLQKEVTTLQEQKSTLHQNCRTKDEEVSALRDEIKTLRGSSIELQRQNDALQ